MITHPMRKVAAYFALMGLFVPVADANFAFSKPNLDLVQTIIRAMGEGNDLDSATRIARLGTASQAASLGFDIPSQAALDYLSIREAASALAERSGLVLTPEQERAVLAFDALPGPIRDKLGQVLLTFIGFDEVTRQTHLEVGTAAAASWHRAADIPAVEAAILGLDSDLSLVEVGVDVGGILAARASFMDAVASLAQAVSDDAGALHQPGLFLDACPAFSLDLSGVSGPAHDDFYATDCSLIVDTAGNDRYFNNAGGNGFSVIGGNPCGLPLGGAAAVVDLAGDDEYGNPLAPRSCGVNGGGFLGTGFLLDLDGHDSYSAGDFGTNGGGLGGTGFLLDMAGSDSYVAGRNSVNGGGSLGLGFLLDMAGSDSYNATDFAANGGGNVGAGLLIDVAGSDTYVAGTSAVNGGAGAFGGLGLLLDGEGSDTYQDLDGGSGTDRTVIPKGTVGFQLDLPPPSDVPVVVPPAEHSQTVPGLSTPTLMVPATCTVSPCTSPTVIPAQSSPPLPQVCGVVICVGPVSPQPLTPELAIPPLCSVASQVCLPPTIVNATPLTPPVTISVTSTGLEGLVQTHVGEFAAVQPITINVGPVPITICPNTCPVPIPPEATLSGSVTVTIAVGAQSFSQTVPVEL